MEHPDPLLAHDRRAGTLVERRAIDRLRSAHRSVHRMEAIDALAGHWAPVRSAVTGHAVIRDRAVLSRHVPDRRDEPERGPRDGCSISPDWCALDRCKIACEIARRVAASRRAN